MFTEKHLTQRTLLICVFPCQTAVGTGVFTCAPREAAGATFRESIVVGETGMLSSEVANLVRTMESEWQASDYNVMTNNCNCFTSALCLRLTGKVC